MIDEEELKVLSGHATIHKMGLCTCPCYDVLLTLGRKIQATNELNKLVEIPDGPTTEEENV